MPHCYLDNQITLALLPNTIDLHADLTSHNGCQSLKITVNTFLKRVQMRHPITNRHTPFVGHNRKCCQKMYIVHDLHLHTHTHAHTLACKQSSLCCNPLGVYGKVPMVEMSEQLACVYPYSVTTFCAKQPLAEFRINCIPCRCLYSLCPIDKIGLYKYHLLLLIL